MDLIYISVLKKKKKNTFKEWGDNLCDFFLILNFRNYKAASLAKTAVDFTFAGILKFFLERPFELEGCKPTIRYMNCPKSLDIFTYNC